MSDCIVETKYPSDCLVPKNETGVLNFLKKYPEYNGDGVTIAIFDTGVDAKAAGLQTTPDGSVKVIERYDCSGCGDVDTSKKVTATDEGTIIGLSGRTLKISAAMKADNVNEGEYHVGLKCPYELYPSKIKQKLILDAKLKKFNEPHKTAIADIGRQIDSFDIANNTAAENQSLPIKQKLKKEDLDNSIEFLNTFEKKFVDINTTYDCILYETVNHWVTVIDISETGDLENALYIGEYSKTHEMKSIDEMLSISVNVYNDGNVLEMVGLCSSHGTHVAAIASANHSPDNCDINGIAPGAKIVSLTIGDNRLGTMETGSSIVRAIIKVMELCRAGTQIHVINMSYGEHAHWSNSGRIGTLMAEVVNKYGVVWVAAASNHGPALSTIGTPPDISQPCIIGVGAYVSPDMMEADYSLRQKLPGNIYPWSSRDPCTDGGQGVTICAPGAAITSVPEYTLTKQQLMNGSSMAAPNAAGAIAILISGLLKNNIKYSPYSIKRAVWNTATKLSYVDPFAQGNGLLNVDKAYDHLVQYSDEPETNIRFSVGVGLLKTKGIYMRNIQPLARDYSVTVEPEFFNDKEISPKEKIGFNMRIALVPSETWVQAGSFLDLSYASRFISIKVDPSGLIPGVHSARLRAYDSKIINKGTLFEIPITVVVPIKLDVTKSRIVTFDTVLYKPSKITRYFISVPSDATWAVLKLKSPDTFQNTPATFSVHTMQILQFKNCKSMDTQKMLSTSKESWTTHTFKCKADNVLEVCITKYWSNFGEAHLEANIEFHGISSNGSNIMHGANGIHRIDIKTLTTEEILPAIQLKSAVMVLKPAESKLLPLDTRDVIPPGRQIYAQLFTYNLNLIKNQEVAIHAPLLCDVLYEAAFESQLWMIFDTNKMMVGCGDAYSNNNFMKLEKGEYVIKLQVRHEKREYLEKVSDVVLHTTIKLVNPLSLDIYTSYNNAILNGKKMSAFQLYGGSSQPIYVAPLTNEKITKAGLPSHCSWLDGSIVYVKDDVVRKIDTTKFEYIFTEGPPVKKPNGVSKEVKNKLDEYKEGLRDYQNGMISKLDLEKAEEVYNEILEAFPNFLPAHISLIQKLDAPEIKNQLPFTYKLSLEKLTDQDAAKNILTRIAELSKRVIDETDTGALLAYYGLKSDNRPDATKIKINMDKQKATLLEAYVKKTIALSKLCLIEMVKNEEAGTTETLDELDIVHTEVGKFIDYADSKVILVTIWHSFMHQHYGRMMKALQKMHEDKLQRDVLEELLHVANERKWDHISKALNKMILTTNPISYRLF